MACERYSKDIDAAAAGCLDPKSSTRVAAHLRACSACRAALEAKKHVYRIVDENLRARVSEDLPAGFGARVHARLDAQGENRSRAAWLGWAGAAALAAVMIALVFIAGLWRGVQHQESQQVTSHSFPLGIKPPVIEDPKKASRLPSISQPSHRHTRIHRMTTDARSIAVKAVVPEVLVPVAQKEGMARLLDSVRAGKVQAAILLSENRETELQPIKIAPLPDSAEEGQARPNK
jgi:hypothetical protein